MLLFPVFYNSIDAEPDFGCSPVLPPPLLLPSSTMAPKDVKLTPTDGFPTETSESQVLTSECKLIAKVNEWPADEPCVGLYSSKQRIQFLRSSRPSIPPSKFGSWLWIYNYGGYTDNPCLTQNFVERPQPCSILCQTHLPGVPSPIYLSRCIAALVTVLESASLSDHGSRF